MLVSKLSPGMVIVSIIRSYSTPAFKTRQNRKGLTPGTVEWVSYDDEETLKLKVDYANKNCLGGVMVWASSLDNTNGDAAAALSNANKRSSMKLANKAASSSTLTAVSLGTYFHIFSSFDADII